MNTSALWNLWVTGTCQPRRCSQLHGQFWNFASLSWCLLLRQGFHCTSRHVAQLLQRQPTSLRQFYRVFHKNSVVSGHTSCLTIKECCRRLHAASLAVSDFRSSRPLYLGRIAQSWFFLPLSFLETHHSRSLLVELPPSIFVLLNPICLKIFKIHFQFS